MEQILRAGDIVLVPFPFTDLRGHKRRPALVVSSDAFNRESPDFIACGITSNVDGSDYSIPIRKEDWKDGLYSESCIKLPYIMCLERRIAIKKIGRLGGKRLSEVKKKLLELLF